VANPAVFCGDSNAILVPFTNWTKAEFTKIIDFSPAVVSGNRADEDEKGGSRPGSLIFHHAQSLREHPASRNVFVIMGKDQSLFHRRPDKLFFLGTLRLFTAFDLSPDQSFHNQEILEPDETPL
jgi:hypothetical protein